ncbi:hypothetical protein ACC759_38070, partial [Rhizobium ruizarguesonis]
RAITGLWLPLGGAVSLDRALLTQWEPSELGRHLGYLPQDVSLFDGSIAQNIARRDWNSAHPEPPEMARHRESGRARCAGAGR